MVYCVRYIKVLRKWTTCYDHAITTPYSIRHIFSRPVVKGGIDRLHLPL